MVPPTLTSIPAMTNAEPAARGSVESGAIDIASSGTGRARNTVIVAVVDSDPMPHPRSGRQFPHILGPASSLLTRTTLLTRTITLAGHRPACSADGLGADGGSRADPTGHRPCGGRRAGGRRGALWWGSGPAGPGHLELPGTFDRAARPGRHRDRTGRAEERRSTGAAADMGSGPGEELLQDGHRDHRSSTMTPESWTSIWLDSWVLDEDR